MSKALIHAFLAACFAVPTLAGTLTYSYDEQHRLAGVNYDNSATITYAYDKANNLIEYNVLTDSSYLKPFMLWHSWMNFETYRPLCYRDDWNPNLWVRILSDG